MNYIRPLSRRSLLSTVCRTFGIWAALQTCFGCRRTSHESNIDFPAPEVFNAHGLVSVHWVQRLLASRRSPHTAPRPTGYANERFVVVEASWNSIEKATEYHRGHIPGAIHVNTDDLETGYPRWQLRDPVELQQAIGRMGIDPQTTVIVYGEKLMAAARVWWALKYAGVADVRLMDGTIDTWRKAGYPVDQNVEVLPATEFRAAVQSDWLATTSDVVELLERNESWLADVRSVAEFEGTVSGYQYLDAKGRIPGAIHLGDADDSAALYRRSDGRLVPPQSVLSAWQQCGLRVSGADSGFQREVIFYCGGGWRSSVTFFYAWLLGLKNVRNYVDGWCGWSTLYTPDPNAEGGTPGWRQVPTGRPFHTGPSRVANRSE